MRSWRYVGGALSASLCIGAVFPGLAVATDLLTSADIRYQQALDSVLADVGNPEKSFDFVGAAIATGDLRGATAALERILLINPQLANIQLELGVLYLRMGNPALAQYHIQQSLKAQNIPTTVRTRAERLLARAGADSGRRNTFSSTLSLGSRFDSNANAGPVGDSVYVIDPFTLRPILVPLTSGGETDDSATELTAVVSHSLAFRSGRGSSWDTDLFGYGVWYSDLDSLNQISVGLESGPTWVFAGTADAPVSIRPFASVGASTLDGDDYFDQAGGGFVFNGSWSAATLTQLRVASEDKDFDDTPSRLLSDRSGAYLNSQLRQVWQAGNVQWMLGLLNVQADADTDYQSYTAWGGVAGVRWFFANGSAMRPWRLHANVSFSQSDYDAADISVNPDIVRDDKRFTATGGLEVGIYRWLSVALDAGYTKNDSNLPNYEYDNFLQA
jgi:hypothetical protein